MSDAATIAQPSVSVTWRIQAFPMRPPAPMIPIFMSAMMVFPLLLALNEGHRYRALYDRASFDCVSSQRQGQRVGLDQRQ